MKKEERLRREGLAFAVRYLKDHTAKELKEEARRSGVVEELCYGCMA